MFWDHHVFVPMTEFMSNNGNMTLVNVFENDRRDQLIKCQDHPIVEWLFQHPKAKWSWLVQNVDYDFNEIMEYQYGVDWPEWRDYYRNRVVRFSFESLADALLFKLTVL
jgi:hypothetical protein